MKRWRIPAGGVAAALLLLAFFYIGAWRPRADKIGELDAETDQLRAQQAPLRRDIKGLEEMAAREGEFTAALQRLQQLIPAELAQPALLAQVQTAAERAGVEVVSITFGDPKIPDGAPASSTAGTVLVGMPLTVVVDGAFPGIVDLLRRVEVEIERAVLVGTVAFTEAGTGFPKLTGTWSGQAYALLRADDPLLVDPTKQKQPVSSEPSANAPPTTVTGR